MTYTLDGYPLTEEQTAIVEAAKRTREDLIVEALAGAGKTSVLRALAQEAFSDSSVYVAYNKSVQTEAEHDFKPLAHVRCKTGHGLAFGAMRDSLIRPKGLQVAGGLRVRDICQGAGIGAPLGCLSVSRQAAHVRDALTRYMHSADAGIDDRHLPRTLPAEAELVTRADAERQGEAALKSILNPQTGTLTEHAQREAEAWLNRYSSLCLDRARAVWAKMMDAKDRFPITHDAYLKAWERASPRIDAAVILVDEAQDLNPVMLSVLAQQTHARKVWVGDSRQQIYEWRGAVDAMTRVDGMHLPLTHSFRFGPEIARMGNCALAALGCELTIVGRGSASTPFQVSAPYTLLCRGNATLLLEAAGLVGNGKRIAVVGGLKRTIKLLASIFALYTDDLDAVEDADARVLEYREAGWEAFRLDMAGDPDLGRLIEFVQRHEAEVASLIEALSRARDVPEDQADVVLCTGHKSKGRQWGQVVLAEDFSPRPAVARGVGGKLDLLESELRLVYVAMTRARTALLIPPALAGLLGCPLEA